MIYYLLKIKVDETGRIYYGGYDSYLIVSMTWSYIIRKGVCTSLALGT